MISWWFLGSGLALLVVGVSLIRRPEAYQRWVLRMYDRKPHLQRLNPFLTWMRSRDYVVVLQLIGVLCLFIAIAFAVVGVLELIAKI
jgi:hypothetical protein